LVMRGGKRDPPSSWPTISFYLSREKKRGGVEGWERRSDLVQKRRKGPASVVAGEINLSFFPPVREEKERGGGSDVNLHKTRVHLSDKTKKKRRKRGGCYGLGRGIILNPRIKEKMNRGGHIPAGKRIHVWRRDLQKTLLASPQKRKLINRGLARIGDCHDDFRQKEGRRTKG